MIVTVARKLRAMRDNAANFMGEGNRPRRG
jgi:hypothetical protein